jgi:hypothetical protein
MYEMRKGGLGRALGNYGNEPKSNHRRVLVLKIFEAQALKYKVRLRVMDTDASTSHLNIAVNSKFNEKGL